MWQVVRRRDGTFERPDAFHFFSSIQLLKRETRLYNVVVVLMDDVHLRRDLLLQINTWMCLMHKINASRVERGNCQYKVIFLPCMRFSFHLVMIKELDSRVIGFQLYERHLQRLQEFERGCLP